RNLRARPQGDVGRRYRHAGHRRGGPVPRDAACGVITSLTVHYRGTAPVKPILSISVLSWPAPCSASSKGRRMLPFAVKMLVAEDSKTVQLFFRKIVERSRWPIELVTADNGRECMMLLEQGGIDLAFIDINMPEMSGMEAVSRARFNGDKTFIALMSGKA